MEETTMKTKHDNIILKLVTALTFIIMVTVNALANILPINGIGTGEVSDSYPNLFAPTGLTFAIWGVIYLLLLIFTIYQLGLFQGDKNTVKGSLLRKIGFAFSISSIANAIWIFSWHYGIIPLSMLLMIIILACLTFIVQSIKREPLTSREKFFIRLPFSVYFGWITVATIANATALLVDLDWNGSGVSEPVWMIIILAVGTLIGIITTIRNKDIAYGLVIVWAYIGIWIKHTDASGFAGKYPEVVIAVITATALILVSLICVLIMGRKSSAGKS
jgi:hypothetical protein